MGSTLRLLKDSIAIALVEESAIRREALTALLTRQRDFAVVAAVPDVCSLSLLESGADVILIDSGLNIVGTEQAAALADAAKRARVLATGVAAGHPHLVELIRVGVSSFVLNGATFAELATAIRSVANGERVTPPAIVETLISNLAQEREGKLGAGGSVFDLMTAQEREIVLLIANGKSNKEIAAHRGISPHTAKSHVRNIMEKLSLHSRLQIAAQVNRERWPQRTAMYEPTYVTPDARGMLPSDAMRRSAGL